MIKDAAGNATKNALGNVTQIAERMAAGNATKNALGNNTSAANAIKK